MPNNPSGETGAALIEALTSDLLQTLDALQFPAFVVDLARRVRWQNAASIDLVGDVRGRIDKGFVAPEDLNVVRTAFARKQLGALHTEYEASFISPGGARVRVAMSSVPIKRDDQTMIGSFALGRVLSRFESETVGAPELTARQRQILTFLAAGCSTSQMAELMGLSKETVRNHVKRLLSRLGARSRVEAVAKGRQANLV